MFLIYICSHCGEPRVFGHAVLAKPQPLTEAFINCQSIREPRWHTLRGSSPNWEGKASPLGPKGYRD